MLGRDKPSQAARFRWARSLQRERKGVATLEFAIITPVLLIMIVGAIDIGQALIVWQETETAAENIAEAAVIQPTASAVDATSNLTAAQAQLAMTIIYGTVPITASTSYLGQFSVTLSGINYINQTPYVAWSVPLKDGPGGSALQTVTRPCGQTNVSTTLPEDSTTLGVIPTQNLTLDSFIVVADVHVQYVPFVLHYFVGKIDFWATNLQQPRTGDSQSTQAANVQIIQYDMNQSSDAYVCPASTQS